MRMKENGNSRHNSRMAQTTQCLQAIQNCMKKVRLKISTVYTYGQFSCSKLLNS